MVQLLKDGVPFKMSKRTGQSVTIVDLLSVVSRDAIRYFMIMRSPHSQLDFDLGIATSKDKENPVYYIQYAYVRINSIIEKANVKGEILND